MNTVYACDGRNGGRINAVSMPVVWEYQVIFGWAACAMWHLLNAQPVMFDNFSLCVAHGQ